MVSGLLLVVAGQDRVEHGPRLVVARDHVDRQLDVGALLLVGQRLADVVEQAAPLGELDVGADLGRQHPRQPGHLLRVLEAVLAVRRPVLEPSHQPDQLGVEAVHADLEAGALALLLEVLLDLLLDLLDDLLDPGRVDPPVGDETLEGQLGDLPAQRIVGGDDDRLRRVVHDEVHARGLLERADVAPLATDDPALHVVGRQVHDGDGRLHGVVGGEPLDGGGEHLARLPLGALARLLLEPHRDERGLAPGLLLHLGEQPLLGFLGRQARDPLELTALLVDHRLLPGLDVLQRLLARAEALLAAVVVPIPPIELVEPPRDLLLLLAQPALEALDLLLALLRSPARARRGPGRRAPWPRWRRPSGGSPRSARLRPGVADRGRRCLPAGGT